MANSTTTYLRAIALVMIGGYRGPQNINPATLRIMFNRYSDSVKIDNYDAELFLELMEEASFVNRDDHSGDYVINQNAVCHAFNQQPPNKTFLDIQEHIKDIAEKQGARTSAERLDTRMRDCLDKQDDRVSGNSKPSNVIQLFGNDASLAKLK